MKKEIKRRLVSIGITTSVGIVLTVAAVRSMADVRGSFRIGGEWLIIPVFLLVQYMGRKVTEEIISVWSREDDWLEEEE